MSWSVSRDGKKDELAGSVGEDFDRQIAYFQEGSEERKECLEAKERTLKLIKETDVSVQPEVNIGIRVNCYGSRTTTDKGTAAASFHIEVYRVSLSSSVR